MRLNSVAEKIVKYTPRVVLSIGIGIAIFSTTSSPSAALFSGAGGWAIGSHIHL